MGDDIAGDFDVVSVVSGDVDVGATCGGTVGSCMRDARSALVIGHSLCFGDVEFSIGPLRDLRVSSRNRSSCNLRIESDSTCSFARSAPEWPPNGPALL